MKEKPIIEFEKEQRELIIKDLQQFLYDECEVELGNLNARRLLDYAAKTLGPLYYNRAVEDAAAFMADKADDLFMLMKD